MSVNAIVKIRYGDSLEKSIGKFKKECSKERVIQSCKERSYYRSKSEERRHERMRAERKQRNYDRGEYEKSLQYNPKRRQNEK